MQKGLDKSSGIVASTGVKDIATAEQKKEVYIMWRSMPMLLRMLSQEDLKKQGYDVDDPIFNKLISIRTETQFCKEFQISNNQPARWREDPEFNALVQKVGLHDHVLRFEKEVDYSFVQKTIKHGDPQRVKLYKQLYTGWSEKIEHRNINTNINVVDLIKQVEGRNDNLVDKNKEDDKNNEDEDQ